MTHRDMCLAAEWMHPLTRRREVLTAVDEGPEALAAALLPCPETRKLYAMWSGRGCEPSLAELLPFLTEETCQMLRLCAQCREGEVLCALSRCTLPPTPAMLGHLVEEKRRRDAMALYGLQMLWRLCGDPAQPDAMTLFEQEEINPVHEEMICRYIVDRLKEADAHG